MPTWSDAIMAPLKTAGETIEKLIETRDLLKFGDDLRKLLTEVIAAHRGTLLANTRELELLDRIRNLEKEISRFETWERESKRYERRNVGAERLLTF
jgi:hypothetical protein